MISCNDNTVENSYVTNWYDPETNRLQFGIVEMSSTHMVPHDEIVGKTKTFHSSQ